MNSSQLKSFLWKLGLDRNYPESTFNKHKDRIPVGSADVAAFLSKYLGNVVARNWKILLACYGNEEMDEDLNECEDFSCPVKANRLCQMQRWALQKTCMMAIQPLRTSTAHYLL